MTDAKDLGVVHRMPVPSGVRNRLAYAEGLLLDEAIVPNSVAARRARRDQPHVAELNRWAEEVAIRERRRVPDFDPASGGAHARAVILLQDPSEVAAHGSRFISRHNNDLTAYNTHRTATAVGLAYDCTVNWNVVPWWVADPAIPEGERDGLTAAARRARPHLRTLFDLLPFLQVVVLLGRLAQQAWDASSITFPAGAVLRAPHPSPLAYNKFDGATGRPNAELLARTFEEAARRIS